jgi:hypothetical protein
MKNWALFCFAICLICYLGCGHDGPNIGSVDMKVADIDVLFYEYREAYHQVRFKIVMYGLHRYQCVDTFGNVSDWIEGNTIHVVPTTDVYHDDCFNPPETAETRAELWLSLPIGEYTLLGYTQDERTHSGYSTEWLVFRVEVDKIVIVRKSLKNTHKFQNRVTLAE